MLSTRLSPVAMTLSADALYKLPDVELLAISHLVIVTRLVT